MMGMVTPTLYPMIYLKYLNEVGCVWLGISVDGLGIVGNRGIGLQFPGLQWRDCLRLRN
jgi:hypothetical protein